VLKASAAAASQQAAESVRAERVQLHQQHQQEKAQLTAEKHEWHARRHKNDATIARTKSALEHLCRQAGACRNHIMYDSCNYGDSCTWKHKIHVGPAQPVAAAAAFARPAAAPARANAPDVYADGDNYWENR